MDNSNQETGGESDPQPGENFSSVKIEPVDSEHVENTQLSASSSAESDFSGLIPEGSEDQELDHLTSECSLRWGQYKIQLDGDTSINFRLAEAAEEDEKVKLENQDLTGHSSNLEDALTAFGSQVEITTEVQQTECDISDGSLREIGNPSVPNSNSRGENLPQCNCGGAAECKCCLQQLLQSSTLQENATDNGSLINSQPMKRHSDGRKHRCEVCGRRFSHHLLLKVHMRRHFDVKPLSKYQSGVCRKDFTSTHELVQHRIQTGEKPNNCNLCQLTFPSSAALDEHVNSHCGVEPVKHRCHVCLRVLSCTRNFMLHMRTHTGEKPFSCEVCSRSFSQKSSCNRHMKLHANDRPYKCAPCRLSFSQKCNYKRHLKVHAGEDGQMGSKKRKYKCNVCKKKFSSTFRYVEHMESHLGQLGNKQTEKHTPVAIEKYQCRVCMKVLGNARNFALHTRTHTGEKPFSCRICQMSFSQKSSCNRHMKVHSEYTDDRPYKCATCMISFTRKCYYMKHLKMHMKEGRQMEEKPPERQHGVGSEIGSDTSPSAVHVGMPAAEKTYKCRLCSTSFSHRRAFNRHIRTHTYKKSHQCSICLMSFSKRRKYIRHMKKSHLDSAANYYEQVAEVPRNHRCNVCMKGFVNPSHFLRHMRTHTGERPYQCPDCPMSFSRKSSCKRHVKLLHSSGNVDEPLIKYQCNMCMKKLSNKRNFMLHMRTHTGEKPYNCGVCNRWFSQKSSLTRHMKVHTGDRPYRCDQCEKAFITSANLRHHIHKLHSDEGMQKSETDASTTALLQDHVDRAPTAVEGLFKCDVCQVFFSHESHLEGHLAEHTGGRPQDPGAEPILVDMSWLSGQETGH